MNRRLVLTCAALVLLLAPAAAPRARIDADLLAGMKARSIGPAGMSGRIVAISALDSDPDTIYVGAATGGLWKSINGGLTWEPLFDDQPVASIGAIAINQNAPDIVWVGTGEANPRNSVSVGNGVYRSLDGGETWTHLGLDATEHIHRIVLHPTDPEVAWVAALGREWGENEERGIFKTVDGGKTWKKVLYVDPRSGGSDLVMDPSSPNKLFATLWDFRRWPWSFRSGGPGSGLYVTHDGGETWTKLTPEDGLPEGDLGRIGVAIAPSDPRVVYALVEAKKNALYGSHDGGKSWEKVGEGRRTGNRPFYFGDIRVDPAWPDRIYSMWSMISVSDDGGKTFRILVPFRDIHPDHHAMWINPRDPEQIYIGNDGGMAMSRDRGKTWRFVENLPLAQYYHVRVDLDTPYHVYGGMQDNGSWRGPATVWENGGIRNHQWEEVGFGDGFDTVPSPIDSMIGYAMSQEGYLLRWNLRTGERKDIRPPAPDGVKLRFNWNAAIAIDPFDNNTLYLGSQFVHRSRDRGETWTILSDDLTTDNPDWQKQDESGGLTPDATGAENFTTIISLAPSPVQAGVLWAGTDDGRLHVTQDGGETWTSVEKNVLKVPAHSWIPHIFPSASNSATAFVVFDNHRRSDWTPYVFRTDNFGRTWTDLATRDVRGYCLSIVQDAVDDDLLFLGTEFGLYVSLDAGENWFKWTHGFPTVAVRDMVIHPREQDLVIGTHGRAAYVLDDIRPLREISEAVLDEPLHLFEVPDAQQYRVKQTGESRFPGHGEFRGENRAYGALITFALHGEELPHPDPDKEKARKAAERARKQAGEEEEETAEVEGTKGETGEQHGHDEKGPKGPQVDITITDAGGKKIRTFKAPAHLGVNRAVWNLRRDAFKEPPREEPRFFEPSGPEVLPGRYTVAVKYRDHEASRDVRVLADPRFDIRLEDRQAKWAALEAAGQLQETVATAIERLHTTGSDIDVVLAKIRGMEDASKAASEADGAVAGDRGEPDEEREARKALRETGEKLKKQLTGLEKRLWTLPDTKGIIAETDALSKVSYAFRNLGSSWDPPTGAQLTYLRQAGDLLDTVLTDLNAFYDEDVRSFRRDVKDAGIQLLAPE
ncbi:MAG: hypothetical protein ACE5IK_13560, partial [Acidobacteriota bacterium]